MLTVGPLTRYAEDLKLMLTVMAGENAKKLNLYENVLFYYVIKHYQIITTHRHFQVPFTEVKVYCMQEAAPHSFMPVVHNEIKECVRKCAEHLRDNCKASIFDYTFPELGESCEMGISAILPIEGIPKLLQDNNHSGVSNLSVPTINVQIGLALFSSKHTYIMLLLTIIMESK